MEGVGSMAGSRAIDNKSCANSAYGSVPFSYWSIGVTWVMDAMFRPAGVNA